MIIYYHKTTGEIVGTTGGRVHQPEELKMWIGDPKEIERIVVEWKPKSWKKEKGGRKIATSFEPDCDDELKAILKEAEKQPMVLHEKYKFNVSSKKIVEKTKEELDKQKLEAKKMNGLLNERMERRKELVKIVADKQKGIEERFNSLIEVLNIKEMK